MTISYNWLSEYLPVEIEPAKLSGILTSVGLEVEKMSEFETVKGGLKGLVIGEVLEVLPHPNADKLKLTKVDVGQEVPLQIVCGAANVAPHQKVVVALVGTTIYPNSGDPLTMKVAKIRNVESFGMICAEDEIGLGNSHAGIMELPKEAKVGMPAAAYFSLRADTVYEIGLTPNRMDAMSHLGVAKDVCAYLSHHEKRQYLPKLPETNFHTDSSALPFEIQIENKEACRRYSGLSIAGVKVGASPKWLQEKLQVIGVRSINNIVDITNFILHETGQPLHAFDYDQIKSHKIVIKTLKEGALFTTLDGKERKLSNQDLMICDAKDPMCIAGVFGGMESGISEKTVNIFLESAWFDPVYIRKTSFRHQLRTDAAIRFEKNIDISNTVNVLKRAAGLIQEIAGGKIASEIHDVYPAPQPKTQIVLTKDYVQKLSGKDYDIDTITSILTSLGFKVETTGSTRLNVEVPYHKPDVSLPADLVEEILRIDGLDNIPIPAAITISPSIEPNYKKTSLKEKISHILVGMGFTEILTNSITNSAFFSEPELSHAVKLMNNLSSELDIMRPTMLHTALEVIRFNTNRKNNMLRFFEFGKTYSSLQPGVYTEKNNLCLYISGSLQEDRKLKHSDPDIFTIKGISEALLRSLGIKKIVFAPIESNELDLALRVKENEENIVAVGKVKERLVSLFDIRQEVYYADFDWDAIVNKIDTKVQFKEIPKYPAVERDLALVVEKDLKYQKIIDEIAALKLKNLRSVNLFDVFESDKLGAGKKSMAFKFLFLDPEKTLTDKEIDSWINQIITTLEKELKAEIRK